MMKLGKRSASKSNNKSNSGSKSAEKLSLKEILCKEMLQQANSKKTSPF